MSTRSVIARTGEQEGIFAGRYVHADGMPTSMGAFLWESLRGHFQNDLPKMLHYLIDAPHAVCGWSSILDKDFNLKPGYTWQKVINSDEPFAVYSQRPDYRRPQCFAGRPGETPYLFTEKDLQDGTDVEWLYVFDEAERKLYVRDVSAKEDVAVVELDGEQPDWAVVECGQNYERCSHYAWKHNLTPRTCNLSTQVWLEKEPLTFRDAVAFVINGKRYKNSGSGGHSDYLRRYGKQNFPPNTWVSSVIAGNGRRLEMATAKILPNGTYESFPGVAWVLPATISQPEKLVSK